MKKGQKPAPQKKPTKRNCIVLEEEIEIIGLSWINKRRDCKEKHKSDVRNLEIESVKSGGLYLALIY